MAAATQVVTNTGRALFAGLQTGDESKPANWYVAWGVGSTDAVVTDAALGSEASESAGVATTTRQTVSVNNDTAQHVATITCAGSGKTICETCVRNQAAASGQKMVMRACFGSGNGIVLQVGDSIQVTNSVKEG